MRASALSATAEVQQTLRLTLRKVERSIGAFRSVTAGVALALTVLVTVLDDTPSWFSAGYFSGLFLYTVVAWRAAIAWGGSSALSATLLILDVVLTAGFFWLRLDPLADADWLLEVQGWIGYALPAALIFIQVVNSLRASVALAGLASLLTTAAYVSTTLAVIGFHGTLLIVAGEILLIGVLCIWGVRRNRRLLEGVARLQLLRRYLPRPALARADAAEVEVLPDAERMTLTVLAADLRGYTSLSEKLAPDEVMALLNEYHATMVEVVERQGGIVERFMGDGMVALFGLDPGGRPTDSRMGTAAALACATGMLTALEGLNRRRAERGEPALKMGIGVHTGEVIIGAMGVPGRRVEFTALGEAPVRAAALEALTKKAGTPVLVSGELAKLHADGHAFIELPELAGELGAAGRVFAPGRA